MTPDNKMLGKSENWIGAPVREVCITPMVTEHLKLYGGKYD
jgi:hypothetical protein